ncbi:YncE family protein [Streptomyces cirratus]|uniref:YncE family protein n=1 Tax=Streptomyces cirratus TaxID=68187 RepID=UPI003616096C
MSSRSRIRYGLAAALLALAGLLVPPSAAASTAPPPSPRPYVYVSGRPYGVALSPDGGLAYVATGRLSPLRVIDTHTLQRTARIYFGSAQDVALSPDGLRAYVTSPGTVYSSVNVVNTVTNTEIGYVGVGDGPLGLAVTPDGRRLYVANSFSDSVSVIDTASEKAVGKIEVGSTPADVVVSPTAAGRTSPTPATGPPLPCP